MTKFCGNCGAELADDAQVCTHCGLIFATGKKAVIEEKSKNLQPNTARTVQDNNKLKTIGHVEDNKNKIAENVQKKEQTLKNNQQGKDSNRKKKPLLILSAIIILIGLGTLIVTCSNGTDQEKVSKEQPEETNLAVQFLNEEPLASMPRCPLGDRTKTCEFLDEIAYDNEGYDEKFTGERGKLTAWDDRAGIVSAKETDLDGDSKKEVVVISLETEGPVVLTKADIYEKNDKKIEKKDSIVLAKNEIATRIQNLVGIVKLQDGSKYLYCEYYSDAAALDVTGCIPGYELYRYESGKLVKAFDVSAHEDNACYYLNESENTEERIWTGENYRYDGYTPGKYDELSESEAFKLVLKEIGFPEAKSQVGSYNMPSFGKNKKGFSWLTRYNNTMRYDPEKLIVSSTITIEDYTKVNNSKETPKDVSYKEKAKDLKTAWNDFIANGEGYVKTLTFRKGDFDGDGKEEAFGVSIEGEMPEAGAVVDTAALYYINPDGVVKYVEMLPYGRLDDNTLKIQNKEFFLWEQMGGSDSVTGIYGLKNGEVYQPEISYTKMLVCSHDDGVITGMVSNFEKGYHDFDTVLIAYDEATGEFHVTETLSGVSRTYYPEFADEMYGPEQ